MPKGQSPSRRMDARRNRLDAEIIRYSGADLPYPTAPGENPSLLDRATSRGVREVTDLRRGQLESMNADALSERRGQRDRIDMNRERQAERGMGTQKFAKGGMVRGCKGSQVSGKGFSGSY